MVVKYFHIFYIFQKSYYRGFSCEVISNKFCKSSYSRPPCWFPLRTGRHWKTQQNIPFYLVHTTLPNYNWVTRISISIHTQLKFQILPWSKLKVQAFFLFVFLHTTLYNKERRDVAKSCANRCITRRANPLWKLTFCHFLLFTVAWAFRLSVNLRCGKGLLNS